MIRGTNPSKYLPEEAAKKFAAKYNNMPMEQLVSLSNIPDLLIGVAEDIGMTQEMFDAAVRRVKSTSTQWSKIPHWLITDMKEEHT